MLPLLLLTLFLPELLLAQEPQCDVPGFCQGPLVGITIADSKADCIEYCQADSDCQWYSYDPADGACNAFSDCPSLETDACPNCVSGEDECEAYTCFVPGECLGFFLDHIDLTSADECLQECKGNNFCEWFTFFEESNICYLYSTCNEIDQECQNCVTGEDECDAQGGQGKER